MAYANQKVSKSVGSIFPIGGSRRHIYSYFTQGGIIRPDTAENRGGVIGCLARYTLTAVVRTAVLLCELRNPLHDRP